MGQTIASTAACAFFEAGFDHITSSALTYDSGPYADRSPSKGYVKARLISYLHARLPELGSMATQAADISFSVSPQRNIADLLERGFDGGEVLSDLGTELN